MAQGYKCEASNEGQIHCSIKDLGNWDCLWNNFFNIENFQIFKNVWNFLKLALLKIDKI